MQTSIRIIAKKSTWSMKKKKKRGGGEVGPNNESEWHLNNLSWERYLRAHLQFHLLHERSQTAGPWKTFSVHSFAIFSTIPWFGFLLPWHPKQARLWLQHDVLGYRIDEPHLRNAGSCLRRLGLPAYKHALSGASSISLKYNDLDLRFKQAQFLKPRNVHELYWITQSSFMKAGNMTIKTIANT